MNLSDAQSKLTPAEAADIGRSLRTAADGNMIVGAFAAELIGEPYPFTKRQSECVFAAFSDEQLGQKFAAWADGAQEVQQ